MQLPTATAPKFAYELPTMFKVIQSLSSTEPGDPHLRLMGDGKIILAPSVFFHVFIEYNTSTWKQE